MEIDEILAFALSLADTEAYFPFGPDNVVFKTKGKVFLILFLEKVPIWMNYKASPEAILEQRETYYEYIFPGYHMNKKHWNTLHINKHMQPAIIKNLIQTSYNLVRK